ncbi:MAG: EAL domain-containing protein [Acidimicrobiia bacterium]|nr:EAL domain-containing protein [Acidimicrobiia bacterium]
MGATDVGATPLRGPWPVRLAVFAVAALGTTAVAAAFGPELGRPAVLLVIGGLEAANAFASVWLSRRFRIAIWSLDGAFVAAGFLILEPVGTIVAVSAGAFVGHVLGRRPLVRAFGMAGVIGVAAAAAVAVFEVLSVDGQPASLRSAAAGFGAVVVMTAVWEMAVGLHFLVESGEPLLAGVRAALRFALPRTPFAASVGYLAGVAGEASSFGPLFAVPPMGAMVFVLAEHFRAERDRERAETLFRTAEAVHASIDRRGVSLALEEAAASLLGAERAEVRSTAPEGTEVGVAIDGAEQRWLVVDGVGGGDASQILPAVAAVGASALENARLVEQISHQSVHDTLTGLPNKVLFDDRVDQAIANAARGRGRFAVVALDLDAFGKVNDSLGHAVGDELLTIVADRLSGAVRAGDTVARLSADVFVLLLADVGTAETAGVITEKLLAAMRRPLHVAGQEIFMTACAGLASFPDDGQEAGHLLRNAGSALHRAKDHGPGSYEIYAQGMNEAAHERLARESELHQAVRRDELRVRYQTQIDLRTGRIIGVEALVRWEHPTFGLLAPAEFVPLAEESGLIVGVDTWVLRHATRQAARWLQDGLPPVRVAVNLSARHFQSPERLVGTIRDSLADSGLPPALLELEVTEGLAVHEESSAEVLQRLRDLGTSISIDDFGTGYSMLGRLHRFPVDRLKIDGSFVREIVSARADAPIVAAIIAMARSLGIETVAEGVERLEQQTFLRNRSCDLAQGFLFSMPAEPEEVARMLRTPSVGFNLAPLS